MDPGLGSLSFSDRIANAIASVPTGRVASYGQIATMAGNPRGARQVVRILNAWGRKMNLPWHRIVNRNGEISLPRGGGYELQRALLEDEGVEFDLRDRIDMDRFGYRG